jgi:hypothetical protein
MKKFDIDASMLCKTKKIGPVLFPEKMTATEMVSMCQKINGKMFLIKVA